ncbi:MAG: hypothetical protein QHJ34_11310 [bacterium]|nr:hypothetical protein [candidate division KSB1 bacterium]MDH7560800.1 hypothetical protein [bacterium]
MHRERAARLRATAAVAGWLLSRLVYGFELSRLTIFRVRPTARVQWVRKAQSRWGVCRWFFAPEQTYCLSAGSKGDRQVVVAQLPPLSRN